MFRIPHLDGVTLSFPVGDEPLHFTPNETSAPILRWALDRGVREWCVFFFEDLRPRLPDDDAVARWGRLFLEELTARGNEHYVGQVTRAVQGRSEQSTAVLVVLDHRLTQGLGVAFGFQRLLVSAGKRSPPDLVKLAAPHAPASDAGLPLRTRDGSRWRVIALNIDDVFADVIEGGPSGVELAGRLRGAARSLFGGPVVVRGPHDEVTTLTRRQVVQRLPRVCCTARVVVDHDARSGVALPTPLTVTWLTDTVGTASMEDLLQAGLADVVVGEGNTPVAPLGALDARTLPPFAREQFTSRDGCVVRAESLWVLPGPAPSAALSWTQAEWIPAHDLFLHHARPTPGTADDVPLHPDEASLLISLVAPPLSVGDGGDSGNEDLTWTSSRLMVLAVVRHEGGPLRDTIATKAARYEVHVNDGRVFVLRHGNRHADFDAFLRQGHPDARSWAFVTAWNPYSQRLSTVENAARQSELRAHVTGMGFAVLDGVGCDDGSDWSEESLLVIGIARADACALGVRFGQHAVLVGELDACAEVCACRGEER
jgi:hypothetical protein